jgi:3-keto-5-aminohexanoate cleavage enzyme
MIGNTDAVLTCALTGVLTDPAQHHVPVTPDEMAREAKRAFDAGATIVHLHFRQQEPGMGRLPSWNPDVAFEICAAIRAAAPQLILNLSTGVVGDDIAGPVACLERVRPEMAALNAGSLNYLKLRSNDEWAWPPMVFDNAVDKVERFSQAMHRLDIVPECECFDTGIVRSVGLFVRRKMIPDPPHISLVMGVESGMPSKASWLPLLTQEMPENSHWQVIAIGRQEVWPLHQRAAEMGANLRTGLEDTFYLPDGSKATSNGQLIEALADTALKAGRRIASPEKARALLSGR